MKNLLSYLFIPILSYILGSCNISISNRCKVAEPQTKTTVYIGKYPIETQIWKPIDSGNRHDQFISGDYEEKLDSILLYVSPTVYQDINGKSIASLTCYLDGYITSETKLTNEDVSAVGVYYYKEDKLYYSFYKKQASSFVLVPKHNGVKSFVSTNDIWDVMRANFDTNQAIGAYFIRDSKELFHHN